MASCVLNVLLVLLVVLHTVCAVSVDCPNIRHTEVSKHRFRTCMRNIRGIINFMCSFQSMDLGKHSVHVCVFVHILFHNGICRVSNDLFNNEILQNIAISF